MNIINCIAKVVPQEAGLEGIYKQIEIAGRTCYKSEDKITESSAKEFVDRMISCGHLAMLEHGTVYLNIIPTNDKEDELINLFIRNPYSRCKRLMSYDLGYAITTNYRVLYENDALDALNYLHNESSVFDRRITVNLTTNIGVTREGNRHRVNSIAEESTRYCNYTTEKFGKEITICPEQSIQDLFSDSVIRGKYDMTRLVNYCGDVADDADFNWNAIDFYLFSLLAAEYSYRNLIRLGWSPQRARGVLPLDTKTTVVYTAFVDDWEHWFDLRYFGTTGKPHPAMYEVARKLHDIFVELNII